MQEKLQTFGSLNIYSLTIPPSLSITLPLSLSLSLSFFLSLSHLSLNTWLDTGCKILINKGKIDTHLPVFYYIFVYQSLSFSVYISHYWKPLTSFSSFQSLENKYGGICVCVSVCVHVILCVCLCLYLSLFVHVYMKCL